MECTETELKLMFDKMAPGAEMTLEEETVQALASLDTDGNGVLEPKQLIEVLTTMGNKMSKAEAMELIEVLGLDQDGMIDFEALIRKIHA